MRYAGTTSCLDCDMKSVDVSAYCAHSLAAIFNGTKRRGFGLEHAGCAHHLAGVIH